MIIMIDESVLTNPNTFNQTQIVAFSNLALAGIEGYHLIICPINLAIQLSTDTRLGNRERAFYKRSAIEHSLLAGLANKVKFLILVVLDGPELKSNLPDGRTCHHVHLDRFDRLDSVNPTKLVCEDLSDCSVLQAITRQHMNSTGFRQATLRIEPVHGGGVNTWLTLKRIIVNESRFAICVIDTDKKPTAWKLGDTAKKVVDYASSNPHYRLGYRLLECHEMENLIPDDIFAGRAGRCRLACPKTGKRIAEISAKGLTESRLYLDIKKGLKLKDLMRCAKNPQSSSVWKPLLDAVSSGEISFDKDYSRCISKGQCESKTDCLCILLSPLGDQLLSPVTTAWDQAGKELWKNLPEFLRQLIDDICTFITSWGCASRPQAT